jgi:hypothetical protein
MPAQPFSTEHPFLSSLLGPPHPVLSEQEQVRCRKAALQMVRLAQQCAISIISVRLFHAEAHQVAQPDAYFNSVSFSASRQLPVRRPDHLKPVKAARPQWNKRWKPLARPDRRFQ